MSFFGLPPQYYYSPSPSYYPPPRDDYYEEYDEDDNDFNELAAYYGPAAAARLIKQKQARELVEYQRQQEEAARLYQLKQLEKQRQREYLKRLQHHKRLEAEREQQRQAEQQAAYRQAIKQAQLFKPKLGTKEQLELQQQQSVHSHDEDGSLPVPPTASRRINNNPYLSLFPSPYLAQRQPEEKQLPRAQSKPTMNAWEEKQPERKEVNKAKPKENKANESKREDSHCRCYYPCDCKDRANQQQPRNIPINFGSGNTMKPVEQVEPTKKEKQSEPINKRLVDIVSSSVSPQEDLISESDAETQSQKLQKLHALTDSESDEEVDEEIEVSSKATSPKQQSSSLAPITATTSSSLPAIANNPGSDQLPQAPEQPSNLSNSTLTAPASPELGAYMDNESRRDSSVSNLSGASDESFIQVRGSPHPHQKVNLQASETPTEQPVTEQKILAPEIFELIPSRLENADGFIITIPTDSLAKNELTLAVDYGSSKLSISGPAAKGIQPVSVELSPEADLHRVSAKHTDGVLRIEVPKLEQKPQMSFINIQ
jgi:hypothetical protein